VTDTWHHSRSSIRRLREALKNADEDTRYRFVSWVLGIAMMGAAIITQFGWVGLMFCSGFVIWLASSSHGGAVK